MRVEVWCGENLQEHGCLRDDFGSAIGGAHTPEGIADLQRIAHRYNNFTKALEALDQMYVKISTGVAASNAECHRWAQLIAELEEVK